MRIIDADALLKSIESDRNCSDMPSQWIDGVNYAINLIELYEPTIKTKQVKYYDDEEQVWKVGSVIVNDSEKPNNLSEFPTGSADTQTYITEDRDTQILDAWQVKQMQTERSSE